MWGGRAGPAAGCRLHPERGERVAQRPALCCRRRARELVSSGRIAKTAATVPSSPSMNAWLQLGHSRLGAYALTTLRSSLSAPHPSHTPTPPSCQVRVTVVGMRSPYHLRLGGARRTKQSVGRQDAVP